MNETAAPLPALLADAGRAQFVAWLREVAPYVHAHRGHTFVVGIEGEALEAGALPALVQDLSLLHALGIRLVLAYGSRPQVQAQLALKGLPAHFAKGLRITDAAALECAKEAAGEIRLDFEAAFSQGLPNTPMANAQVRVIGGNFVTARPLGIDDGVDFQLTGVVRKVDADAIRYALGANTIVLAPPLGFSPTGEAFNLAMEDVAAAIAAALRADKLIFVGGADGVRDASGTLHAELTAAAAERLLAEGDLAADCGYTLRFALRACRAGVPRAHLIPYALDGSVLVELFTHDGVGTMLVPADLEHLREASVDDVGGVLKVLAPLEADGSLVRRPRELIEREIGRFSVLEHDGLIYGCAALYAYPEAGIGEMAAVAVHPDYQGHGDGERLLRRVEARARAAGLVRLFVLTTRTHHWFRKRGFVPAEVEDLPLERQRLYNWQRRSQVLIKTL